MAQYGATSSAAKNIWGFDPTSIGGCTLWLDGADRNTLFSDGAGTTLATSEGNVLRWNDKSVSANNATSNRSYSSTLPTTSVNWPISTATTISFVTGIPTTTYFQGLTAGNTLTVTGYAPSQFNVTNATISSIATSYSVSVNGDGTTATYTITSAAPNNTTLGLVSGSTVTVTGFSNAAFNRTFTMATQTSTQFTVANATNSGGTLTDGTVTSDYNFGQNAVITVSSSAANGLTVTSATSPTVVWTNINYPTLSGSSVAFTGGQYFGLTPSSFPSGTANGTYFVVASTNSSSRQTIFAHGSNAPGQSRYFQVNQTANNASFLVLNAIPYPNSGTATLSNSNIITGVINNSIQSGWINGTSFSTANNGDVQSLVSGGLNTGTSNASIGLDYGYSTSPFSGNIYEILVYNSTLSNTDRQNVEGYLAWKWGLQASLPTTHPYYGSIRPFSRQFVPTDISNCILWFDGGDMSSMFQNTAGTTPVTGTGQTIAHWRDKSGNGNNITSSAGPTLTISSNPQKFDVVFNGTSQSLGNTNITNSSNTYTKFLVFNRSNIVSAFCRLFAYATTGEQNTADPTGFHIQDNNSTTQHTLYKSFASAGNFTIATGTYYIATIVATPFSMSLFLNGSTTASSTITYSTGTGLGISTPNFNGRNFYLARTVAGGFQYFPGFINEVISYNRQLSTYEYQRVEGYLAWKWGLRNSLPSTHPFYKYYPPSLTPIQPELQLYKPTFDISDLSPVIWIDPQDNSVITKDATTGRATIIQNKGTLSYQSFNVSSSTGSIMTLTAANPYIAVGQPVIFTSAPSGLTAGVTYYVFTYTIGTPSFQVTTTLGGASPVSGLTGSGSGYVSPSFTVPLIGTGSGIIGPLVTTSAIGTGLGAQFLDFSNGGHYQVISVSVGASPFTQLTLTISPPHNGYIPVGAFVNFTPVSGTYPNGVSATRTIGPFQIQSAIISGGTTLTITTLSAHSIGNSESVFLTINTGTYFGGADASGLTGGYTTNAIGNTGSTIILTIPSSTNGLMAISDGHVRNNVGTVGAYITQSGTTGSTVILTSYSARGTAGALSNFVGRLEYGSIPITSATFATTPSNSITLRTPINHGLTSGTTIGLGFNSNFTLPFLSSIGTSTNIGGACVQFTSATISENTTLTITVTTNPFYYLVGGTPTYTGITTNLRLTLPTGTQFSDSTSATGLNGTTYTIRAGSNATTIVLSIASSINGGLSFTGLPGMLDSAIITASNSNILNSTQTTSVGTTGNTIVCPVPTFPSGTTPITGRLLRTSFPSHTSDNTTFQGTSIYFPVNGYAIENPALSTALNTTNSTIVWVSHTTTPINRNSGIGTTGSLPATGQQSPVIATASAINNNSGTTVNDYAIRIASFAGNASRYSSKYNNAGNFSYFISSGFTDSISPFRVHTAFFNLTNSAIGDCSGNARGIATNGGRYDNTFLSNPSGANAPYSLTAGGLAANTLTPIHMRIGGDTNATTAYTTYPLTNFWYEGGVGDILIFNSILTTEQRQLVEGYLAQKYATQSNLGSTSVTANTTASYTITGGSVSGSGPFTITINGTFTTAFVNGSQVTISGATPSGLNATWTAASTSTTAVTFLSPTSLTWSSSGTISGITTNNGTFIHPYRLNPTTIYPSLTLTNTYAQGLAAWFDAANSTTIGFASSNNVNSWVTAGGNFSLTLVPDGTNYPTLVQNAQNGLPGMRFAITGGTGSPLGTSFIYPITNFSTLSSNNEFTIITVYKQPTFTSSQAISNVLGNTDDPRLAAYTNQFSYRNTTTEQVKNYTANVNGQTYVTVYYRRGNTLYIRDNGTTDTGSTTSGTNLSIPSSIGSTFGVTLGGYRVTSPTTSPFAGDIYEHIIFRYALTDQAIFQIEGYLAWKWGIRTSLPTTHPYYRVRP